MSLFSRSVPDSDTPLGRSLVRNTPQDVKVTVTEKRAPTDESVRLLKEMEEAAEDRIISRIKIEGNLFRAKAMAWYSPATDTTKIRIVFTLNGHEHDWTVDGPDGYRHAKPIERLQFVQKQLAERLAWILTEDVAKNTNFVS